MKNDPWHFVDNRTWEHFGATWKTKSVKSKFVPVGRRLKKEIESLKQFEKSESLKSLKSLKN